MKRRTVREVRYLAEDGETRRIDREYIEAKLPDIADFTRTYLGVDPVKEPMPIQPTAHYAMGGIPTDVDGRVLLNADKKVLQGMYAAGECACVSVHGANRLGTNSLTDLVVFGRRAGQHMAELVQTIDLEPLPANAAAEVIAAFERIRHNTGAVKPYELRQQMQQAMTTGVSVFRTEQTISKTLDTLNQLRAAYQNIQIQDKGKVFNSDLLEAWELGCLLELAEVTAVSALARQESRGGHARDDFPNRDDQNWLTHTLCHKDADGRYRLTYKPVTLGRYQPKARVY